MLPYMYNSDKLAEAYKNSEMILQLGHKVFLR